MEKKEKIRNSYSELPKGGEPSPTKAAKKKSSTGKENREIRFLKKSKSIKEKNDPDRFSGDGINFRAKIIGIEDVFDARGNRMCQSALQKLKAAVKTSGDHKQRIILNISLSGIIIKDEKTGEILHHHPIHKISCISQDTKDNRAFGFVYGCPQTGHRFFAIKTEKAASQVVVTLRDLFLVALEIKKKEIENTVNTQKENGDHEHETDDDHENGILNGNAVAVNHIQTDLEKENVQGISRDLLYSNTVLLPEEFVPEKIEPVHLEPDSSNDNLLDLQSEVSYLQQGISQIDQSIAHTVTQNLGISISEDDVSESSTNSVPTSFQIKLDKLSSLYHETLSVSSHSSSTSDYNVCGVEGKQEESDTPKRDPFRNSASGISDRCSSEASSLSVGGSASETSNSNLAVSSTVEDRYAVFQHIDSLPSIFDNPSIIKLPEEKVVDVLYASSLNNSQECEETVEMKSSTPVAFVELDPLGNQPYVDKKDFFQDLKKPPKKNLKEMIGANSFGATDGDALSDSHESLTFCDLKSNHLEASSIPVKIPTISNLPRLPPKQENDSSLPSKLFQESELFNSDAAWEPKNVFNPFLDDDYPNLPPPSSPPPPPPPRLPSKVADSSSSISPPPPRPPSRVNGIPTPPLPKRKVPLSSTNRTWFSFDQDAVFMPPVPSMAELDSNHTAPPLPSPARKLPPPKPETAFWKSSSASNSPATFRRFQNKSPCLGDSVVIKENCESCPYLESNITKDTQNSKANIITSSPCKVLSRHSSIVQEDAFSGATFNPFKEIDEFQTLSGTFYQESQSPPLPPKPVSQLRPSPVKRVVPVPCTSSLSSSGVSVTESSNGTHSSSSLVFSSSDDNKISSSSAEALFIDNSIGSQSDIPVQKNCNDTQLPSSNSTSEKKKPSSPDISPDSIFRRKSDPFADDFFLSLHKKPDEEALSNNQCSTTVEVPFGNIKAPS